VSGLVVEVAAVGAEAALSLVAAVVVEVAAVA